MNKNFMIGQVVEWHNCLWIIAEVHTTDNGLKGVELIDLSCSNVSAHPSKTWPANKKHRVDSIKVVADCMKEFFTDKIEHLFQWGWE